MVLFKPSIGIIFYNIVKWKRLGLWSHKDMVSFTQSTNKAQKNKKLKLKKGDLENYYQLGNGI